MTEEDTSKLTGAVTRLTIETSRLLRDVERLAALLGRTRPELEPIIGSMPEPPTTVTDALKRIEQSRRMIIDAERHLAALRATIQAEANGVVSREEMKPFMKDDPSRGRKR